MSSPRRGCFRRAATTVLLLGPLAAAAQQGPLPDLNAIIDESVRPPQIIRNKTVDPADVAEGCAGGPTGRTLLAFTLSTQNLGTADLVMGDPGCPSCHTDPPPACLNPLYECSLAAGHNHAHFSRFARYEVLAEPGGAAVVVGRKQGFCIEDTVCPLDKKKYDCSFQGITAGCSDSYPALLGCQYVDITDLPGGRYLLRASVNIDRVIPEASYDNNSDETPFEICDATQEGTVRLTRVGRPKGGWLAEGHVTFAKTPLVDPDPARDGALLRIGFDQTTTLEAAIPGGARGTGCARRDGWKKLRGKNGWIYTNASGFLDAACTVSAGGLRRLKIVRIGSGFSYAAKGRPIPGSGAVPARARVTVVMGQVAGPCGEHASPCTKVSSRKVTCTGVDPCVADPNLPGCGGGGGGGTVPGPRRLSPAEGAEPAGSHFFTSGLTGGDVSNDGFTGGLELFAGPPGPDGVASLRVASDSTFGFNAIDGSFICVRVDAAGSEGKIDCDGGTPVDVTLSGNSHFDGPNDPLVLTTEQGAPAPSGAGYVKANVRIVNCGPTVLVPDPACTGTVASPADCVRGVNFELATNVAVTAFTTGSATAEVVDPDPASLGGALPQTRTGSPFDCSGWAENGPGVLVAPQVAYGHPVAGDSTNLIQLDD